MKNYTITYNGIMLAMNRDDVVGRFASLFNISPERSASILAKPGTVLRRCLDASSAERYRERLMTIGLDIDVSDATALSKGTWLTNGKAALPEPWPPLELVPLHDELVDGERLALYHGNRILPFECEFAATAFFRVWIVNVLLTILTAGVYLAWAKARKRQYFYGNTSLANAPFKFEPGTSQISQACMIGISFLLVLLLLCLGVSRFSLSPEIAAGGFLLLLLAAPALLVILLSAKMRCVEWRRVRFSFERDFAGAYRMALLPLIFCAALIFNIIMTGTIDALSGDYKIGAIVFLLLFFPYWQYLFNSFLVSRSGFGGDVFSFSSRASAYYKLYFLKVPALLLILMLLSGLVLLIVSSADMLGQFEALQSVLKTLWQGPQEGVYEAIETRTYLTVFIIVTVTVAGLGWVLAYMAASLFNLRYHGVSIGKSLLYSNMRATPLLLVYAGNALAILFSAGLLIPWACVRLAKFRLECLDFHASYELDDIINEARRVSATS